MERPRKLFKGSICNFQVSKICKKGYIEMTKKIYLEPLKSILGRSILHYSPSFKWTKCSLNKRQMVFPPTFKGPWSTTKTSCINTTTFFFNLKISPEDLTILNIFRSTKAMLIRLSMVLCWQDLIFPIEIQASFTSNTFKSSFRLKLIKN